jgi:hypothetical protein
MQARRPPVLVVCSQERHAGGSCCTTRLQNTHGTEEREVLYPWHPWVGCIVQIHKVVEKASGNVARCSREGAAVCRALELPTWMFDRAACAPMRMDARPRVIPRYDLDQS